MSRVAQDRIADLFGLADREAARGLLELSDRYVRLARRVGTRYNIRLIPEYRDRFCRRCSCFWVEGRTVRTRLRNGGSVQTCLNCGGYRRRRLGFPRKSSGVPPTDPLAPLHLDEGATIDADFTDGEDFHGDPGEGP